MYRDFRSGAQPLLQHNRSGWFPWARPQAQPLSSSSGINVVAPLRSANHATRRDGQSQSQEALEKSRLAGAFCLIPTPSSTTILTRQKAVRQAAYGPEIGRCLLFWKDRWSLRNHAKNTFETECMGI